MQSQEARIEELEQEIEDLQHDLDMANDEILGLQNDLDSMEDAKEESCNEGFNAALELIRDYAGEIER